MNKNFLTLSFLAVSSLASAELSDQPSIQLTASDKDLLINAVPNQPLVIPSISNTLQFKPINIYANSSSVKLFSDAGNQSLSPSGRLFFISINTKEKVAMSFNPNTSNLHLDIHHEHKKYHAQGVIPDLKNDQHTALKIFAATEKMAFDCLNDLNDQLNIGTNNLASLPQDLAQIRGSSSLQLQAGGSPTFQATVAVDTDNEFLWNKFNNDTFAATNWVEDLFLNMNLIYESELDIRIQLASLFLRVDTTPINNPNFNADPANFNNGLTPFGDYWDDNYDQINRVTALLISGKDIGNFSFSGVAWVNAYCNETFSYSFNRVGSGLPASFTAGGIAHELGHNFGSSHTHCEQLANGGSSFVDQCYSNESNGCYVGATSCPGGNNGNGTLMSYCHAPAAGFDGGGPAMGPPTNSNCDTSDDMHPLIASKLAGRLTANFPVCITNFDPNFDVIFADDFE